MVIIVVTNAQYYNSPRIVLNEDYFLHILELNVGEVFVRPTATAKDDIDYNDISSRIKITGSVDTSKVGVSYITYTVTDTRGNIGLKVLSVEVYENLPPRITLNGADDILIDIDETYIDAGARAEDFTDGVVEVKTTGTVDTSKLGTYRITYTATDKAGASSYETRSVEVVPARPVITLEGPGISMDADGNYNLTLQKGDSYPAVNVKSKATLKGVNITVTRPFRYTPQLRTDWVKTFTYKFSAVDPKLNAFFDSVEVKLIVVVQEHPLTAIVRQKIGKDAYTNNFTKVGNKTYFTAIVGGDTNLYITDGTSAGTHFIKRLGLAQFNTADQFTVVGGSLFFRTQQSLYDINYMNAFVYKVTGTTAAWIDGMSTHTYSNYVDRIQLIGNENGSLLYKMRNKTYLYNLQSGKITQR